MDIYEKVANLGQAAAFDYEGPPALTRAERKQQAIDHSRVFVTHPQRGQIPLMRTMQTSAGERTLYCEAGLSRTYYSAFKPTADTTFADKPRPDRQREHRLYQPDWLLRFYGFKFVELPFTSQGNLPLADDPKLVWAKANLRDAPLEINQVSRQQLLRIPGIGPQTAQAVIIARRQNLTCGS
jgi:predicted DNA-binding helix-hairpin-helix protein